MATAGSRIAVEVTASASELQAQVAKAADSLKGLGDVVAKQSKASASAGEMTVRTNRAVALSYEQMARTAVTSTKAAAVSYDKLNVASKATAVQTAKTAEMQKLLAAQTKAAELQTLRSTQALRKDEEAHKTHQGALARTGTALDNTGKKLQNIGHVMAPVSLGLLGIGVYSIKAATTFQASMELLRTQAGASQAEVKAMTKAVLNLAPAVDIGPNELAKGLFHVESAGYRGKEALGALDSAAKGAAIGQANLEDVTNSLIAVLKTGIGGVHGARDAMGQLNDIIGEGNMRMQDLTAAIATGLPLTAKQVGISLKDMGAALDLMTIKGVPAAKAATSLRFALMNMAAPTKAANKELESIGLRQGQLAEDLQKHGLLFAVRDLTEHMHAMGVTGHKETELLKAAFGGVRSSAAILTLTQDVGGLEKKLKQLGSGEGAAAFAAKFKATSETSAFKWHQMTATIESDSIKMGQTLLPVANKIVGDVTKLVDGFSHLPAPVKTAMEAMVAFGAVVAPIALAMGTVARIGGVAFKGAGGLSSVMRGTAFGGGQISGARSGGMGPGSAGNPIVTVMEDAQYAGLGGRAAPGGTATGTVAEQGKAGSTPLGGKLAGIGSKVLGRAVAGGTVLGLGVGASELAGTAIGGKTGGLVSGIGTDTAFGAAIGTAIEPGLGTAIGGGLGAIAGAIKAFGPKPVTAPETRAPGTPKLGAQFQAEADRIFRAEQADIRKQAPGRARVGRGGQEEHFHTAGEESAKRQIQEAFGGQRGEILGKAESQFVLGGVKFPGVESIVQTVKRQLTLLPPAGRESMMTFVKQMAQTLEHEGRIPRGSLQHMIQQFKPLLAQLPQMAGASSAMFSQQFNRELKTQEMQAKVADVVKGIQGTWAREFKFLPVSTHMTMTEVLHNAGEDLNKLKYLMTHGTQTARDEAAKQYAQLAPTLKKYTKEATGAVDGQLRELARGIGPLASQGTQAFLSVYNALPPALQNELARSAGAVGKGIDKINKELVDALKAMGVTVPKGANLAQLQSVKAAVEHEQPVSVSTPGGVFGATKAMGGFVGNPGERGADTVRAVLGRGEAVLNYQQQAIADRALTAGGYGGLSGLFSATAGTRHHMAGGGYAGYSLPLPKSSMMPGSWSIDQGVDIPAPAGTPEFAIGPGTIIGEGIQGFGPNAPILKISQGPLAGMNVYYGHAGPDRVKVGQSVSAGQQISEVGAGIVGISTGPHIEVGFGPPFSTGNRMAQVLRELMSGAGVAGFAGGPVAQSIATPAIGGPGGSLGALGKAAVSKVAGAANALLGRLAPEGAGVVGRALGPTIGGPWQSRLRQIAQQRGWSEHDWLEIVASESGTPGVLGSGDPKAVESKGGAFGLGQVLGATRSQFPKMTSPDGATQIEGMAEYIASRYGNPTAAWAFHLAHNYYGTGSPTAYASSHSHRTGHTPPSKGLKATKTHKEKPGTKLKKQIKPLTPKQLQSLASLSGKIVPKWEDAQGLATRMQGLDQLFQAQEGEEQYLNPDGSLNPAGIAKKMADEGQLVGWQEEIVNDYTGLLPLVSQALSQELGKESNVEGRINKDKAIIAKDNKTLGVDKEKIARLRAVMLALKKPTPDVVKAIQAQITQAKAHWDPLVKAAEAAKAGYVPQGFTPEEYVPAKTQPGKAGQSEREANEVRRREIDKHNREGRTRVGSLNADERRQLEAAVREVKAQEDGVLTPLRDSLARAKAAQAAHKLHVALEGFHLQQQISGISKADLKLTNKDKALSETDAQLKEALGGQAGAATVLGVIENIAGQLGTVKWDSAGHFVGIDTSDQGAAFNAAIQLVSLRNDLAGVARSGQPSEPAATSTQENSALVSLLQQQNTQLSEAYALSQAQFKVLTTFAPTIPHFASGGPVLRDGLIYAHEGEHVVPAKGALVRDSAQRTPEVVNHFTVEGSIAPLIDIIDQRVRHPDNARHISTHIGRRTSMLAGAPGGFR